MIYAKKNSVQNVTERGSKSMETPDENNGISVSVNPADQYSYQKILYGLLLLNETISLRIRDMKSWKRISGNQGRLYKNM